MIGLPMGFSIGFASSIFSKFRNKSAIGFVVVLLLLRC